jgi:hypothetical protein
MDNKDEYQKNYYALNKEHLKQYAKEYYQRNKESILQKAKKRRQQLNNATVSRHSQTLPLEEGTVAQVQGRSGFGVFEDELS